MKRYAIRVISGSSTVPRGTAKQRRAAIWGTLAECRKGYRQCDPFTLSREFAEWMLCSLTLRHHKQGFRVVMTIVEVPE